MQFIINDGRLQPFNTNVVMQKLLIFFKLKDILNEKENGTEK